MGDTPTMQELHGEMMRLSRLVDKGVQALTDAAREFADAEDGYRAAKATAYLSSPEGTVAEREAHVDDRCGAERRRRNLAEGQRLAALEAVRCRRGQLSALQTVANAVRAEVELVRTGPERAA